MIKFCISFHWFLVFSVIEIESQLVVFTFGKISLFFLVFYLCNLVLKKLQKVSGRLFFSSSLRSRQLVFIMMLFSLSNLDSLYKLSTNSCGQLKFNVCNALFYVLSIVSEILLCFCSHIWHPFLRWVSKRT